MATDGSEAFRKVVEYLSRTAAPHGRDFPITEDTEVYDDLRVYGDDIVELVWWLDKEFGLKSTGINPSQYAPGEFPFSTLRRALGRLFGIKTPHYESFKVRDIVAAIEAGRWPDR